LFLTDAAYKSPYNIQIRQIDFLSNTVKNGDVCLMAEGSIIFPQQQLSINLQSAESWQPNRMIEITNSLETQAERIDAIVHRMCEIDPNKGWLFLENCEESVSNSMTYVDDRIKKNTLAFVAGYKAFDMPACLDSAKSIIGLGGGLTPSGDDWITGFLLLLSRANQTKGAEELFTNDLGKSLTELAFQKTTKISANRIEAACTGWAEELFLDLIDNIFITETKLSNTKIEYLMNFGHSSGVDTCMGIFAAWSTGRSE
jgi:hypothetical protein